MSSIAARFPQPAVGSFRIIRSDCQAKRTAISALSSYGRASNVTATTIGLSAQAAAMKAASQWLLVRKRAKPYSAAVVAMTITMLSSTPDQGVTPISSIHTCSSEK